MAHSIPCCLSRRSMREARVASDKKNSNSSRKKNQFSLSNDLKIVAFPSKMNFCFNSFRFGKEKVFDEIPPHIRLTDAFDFLSPYFKTISKSVWLKSFQKVSFRYFFYEPRTLSPELEPIESTVRKILRKLFLSCTKVFPIFGRLPRAFVWVSREHEDVMRQKRENTLKILCTSSWRSMKRIRCALDEFPLTTTHRTPLHPPTHPISTSSHIRIAFGSNTHNRNSTEH